MEKKTEQPSKEVGRKDDKGKLRYDLIKPNALKGLAEVLTYGSFKYSDDNWLNVPDGKKRYYAALMRHLESWRQGQSFDEETQMRHLHHAFCNLMFLCEYDEMQEKKVEQLPTDQPKEEPDKIQKAVKLLDSLVKLRQEQEEKKNQPKVMKTSIKYEEIAPGITADKRSGDIEPFRCIQCGTSYGMVDSLYCERCLPIPV